MVTGGGSGHLPLFMGYIGEGMLDGCAVGNTFASPSARQIYRAAKEAENGGSVFFIYGNYGGDKMNFKMAMEMCRADGIKTDNLIVADDVASAPRERHEERRGVAGLFYAYKIAGACADRMAPLEQVKNTTRQAMEGVRSMGVALSPCIIPSVGRPTFTIAEDEMDVGMGIHGEHGVSREKMKTADEITDRLLSSILPELPYQNGDEVSVLVNGLGATPREELFIVYRRVFQVLGKRGIPIYRPYVGEFATSMEMAGMSITLFRLQEDWKALLDAPIDTPFVKQVQEGCADGKVGF